MNIFDSLEEYGKKHKEDKKEKQNNDSSDNYNYYDYEPNYSSRAKNELDEDDLGCVMTVLFFTALICLYQFLEDLCFAIDEVIRAHIWSFSIFIVCAVLMLIIYLNTKR